MPSEPKEPMTPPDMMPTEEFSALEARNLVGEALTRYEVVRIFNHIAAERRHAAERVKQARKEVWEKAIAAVCPGTRCDEDYAWHTDECRALRDLALKEE